MISLGLDAHQPHRRAVQQHALLSVAYDEPARRPARGRVAGDHDPGAERRDVHGLGHECHRREHEPRLGANREPLHHAPIERGCRWSRVDGDRHLARAVGRILDTRPQLQQVVAARPGHGDSIAALQAPPVVTDVQGDDTRPCGDHHGRPRPAVPGNRHQRSDPGRLRKHLHERTPAVRPPASPERRGRRRHSGMIVACPPSSNAP